MDHVKKQLRSEILNERKNLPIPIVSEKSGKISELLKSMNLYKNAQSVMVYIDFRNEVKTNDIINDLLSKNKRVVIPISIPETREMILSQLLNPGKELTKGTYGILEPKKEYIREVNPETIDLILVPGVAFDEEGYRLGYGGGYYDRFLDKLTKNIPSIALAFDLQIMEKVPRDVHDHAVDSIVTESRIISCNQKDQQ
ncbi:5-formyltetrahydrofolate cyclo-ligase [Lutibacter sp. B2]|nr:5-formyltetrahydrofolate cyclo-ligase [Lutibacter sp. B2]